MSTEIKLNLDDPAATVALLKEAARHAGGTGWDHTSARHADWLAHQIELAQLPKAPVEEPTETFPVATICGSMRFYDRMIKVAERLTAEGIVVLMPFVTIAAADQGDDFKASLDRMHRQKIDMSDRIVVVTDSEHPYIGESTNSEIQYAAQTGKPIGWALEPATSPAEAVEADALDLESAELQEWLTQAIGDPGSVVGRQHHINESVPRWAMRAVLHVLTGSIPTQPTPEQVEAASAPGVPVEKVREVVKFLRRWASQEGRLVTSAYAYKRAADYMENTLLPKEPTS